MYFEEKTKLMSRIKYNLGILFAVLFVLAGGIYIYFEHYAPMQPKNDIVINAWYVNDDAMWQRFSKIVNEYNSGEGGEYGITVKAKAFSSRTEMYDKICKAIDEGGVLPDVAICDTDFAAYMDKQGALADMNSYFGSWETASFNSAMVEQAKSGDKLVAVPLAAETGVFMVNTDVFSDTEAISNFEKLCSVSDEYYGRTGNSFFTITDYSMFFRTAVAQLHDSFDAVSPHDTDNKNSKYIYKLLAESAYNRGFTAPEDNTAKQVAEGELGCAVISSADIMKYAEYIDADSIEFLKYPCMKDGDSVYTEKVTGAVITKSDSETERSAVMFLSWLASEEINSRMTEESGYIPANCSISSNSDYAVYEKLMDAVAKLQSRGERYTYPASAVYSENSRNFDNVLKAIMGSLS